MPTHAALRATVGFHTTPRFEIFYALRALGEISDRTAQWRQGTEKLLDAKLRTTIKLVAPRPMIWALLADTLRDAKPALRFTDIIRSIESLDDESFQRAILGGVFRGEGTVDRLLGRQRSLAAAVNSEAESGNTLASVLGLHPYNRSSPVANAFSRILAEPAAYRSHLTWTLDQFWNSAFRQTWESLEAPMASLSNSMRGVLEGSSLSEFAQEVRLPIAFDDRRNVVESLRGSTTFAYESLREINVIPSAFNDARIWGAYKDGPAFVRLYLPVFEPMLLQAENNEPDPEIGFRVLGDTTRYAMAFFLADSPTTSVELAKAFGVSKATISHHVQLLRAAGLLRERATEKGVELSLDRSAVERISAAAAAQMFAGASPRAIRRSRHQEKATRPEEGKQARKSSRGATE
ncbi:MAG: winged helix-turn-helix domain-containing protein [Gemmatimonadales bacterium]